MRLRRLHLRLVLLMDGELRQLLLHVLLLGHHMGRLVQLRLIEHLLLLVVMLLQCLLLLGSCLCS